MSETPKPKPARAATLADVGRAAGVSAMAASAVLNGARTSSRTAPETRERILAAAKKLRYRPNAAARALAERRMNTLGVAAVFQGQDLNQYFLEVFNGVVKAAAQHGQNTTVFTLKNWEDDASRLPIFCDGRIDGLILIAPILEKHKLELLPDHTPSLSIHGNRVVPGLFNLETDEEKGAFDAVDHLIKLGHRRIMYLSGPRGLVGPERRLGGYHRALMTAGIEFDPTLEIEADFSVSGGGRAFREWLRASTGLLMPSAIFAANDLMATGCIEVLSEHGFRVPLDLSVVGFDDTLAARTTVPQLTTVRQPLRAMGSRAVELLLSRINALHQSEDGPLAESVIFPTELVVRASTSAPPDVARVVPTLKS